jgi:two-component system, NarL family, response regulator DevR
LGKIRVFICEDDPLFQKLLRNYLNKQEDIEIIGTAGTKAELLESIQTNEIDVLLLDIHLSDQNYDGVEAAIEINALNPALKIIILSAIEEEELINHVYSFCKVTNYITKEHYRDSPNAIREAYFNKSGIHYSSAQVLLKKLAITDEQEIKKKITPTQINILQLLDEGYDHVKIAEILSYSKQSISNEIYKISSILRSKFHYHQWLRTKKYNTYKIIRLAKELKIIP